MSAEAPLFPDHLRRIEKSLDARLGAQQIKELQSMVDGFLTEQRNWEGRLRPAALQGSIAPLAKAVRGLLRSRGAGRPVADLRQQAACLPSLWDGLLEQAKDEVRNRWAAVAPGDWMQASERPYSQSISRNRGRFEEYLHRLVSDDFEEQTLDELLFRLERAVDVEVPRGNPRRDHEYLFFAELVAFFEEVTGRRAFEAEKVERSRVPQRDQRPVTTDDIEFRKVRVRHWPAFKSFARTVVDALPADKQRRLGKALEDRVDGVFQLYDNLDATGTKPIRVKRGERARATRWLKDLLAGGSRWPRDDVVREARIKGISEATLNRARRDAGVVVERDPTRRGRPSTWHLPLRLCPEDYISSTPSAGRRRRTGD